MDNSSTYISILINTLTKKNQILEELLVICVLQNNYLIEGIDNPESIESFDKTIDQKENYIQALNQLDDGFDTVYQRVKEEISLQKSKYKEEILKLQDLIHNITDKSVKIQALERNNKLKFDIAFVNSKKEIKQHKQTTQSVSKYYQNVSSKYQNESYFLDKKK